MLTTSATGRPMAAVHVDLDGARHIYRAHGWSYDQSDDPLFKSGLQGALEVLDQAHVRATLFVIAEDMSDASKRSLVQAAVRAGHEVASHSVTHRRLTDLGLSAKREEIIESRQRLASALGISVQGFRAPGFHIDRECLEAIAEAGYAYDSSLFSSSAAGGRARAGAPYRPVPDRPLIELPVPSLGVFSLPFHPSYSLVAGDWYFKACVRNFRRTNAPFILLFHLTDFAEPLRSARIDGWKHQLFTLSYMGAEQKRARCRTMLEIIRSHFTVTTTPELLDALSRSASG